MEIAAAKLIGAGLAVAGVGGVGTGIGHVFAAMISAIARNPAAAERAQIYMWIGFALVEAVAFYALLVALYVLFVA